MAPKTGLELSTIKSVSPGKSKWCHITHSVRTFVNIPRLILSYSPSMLEIVMPIALVERTTVGIVVHATLQKDQKHDVGQARNC